MSFHVPGSPAWRGASPNAGLSMGYARASSNIPQPNNARASSNIPQPNIQQPNMPQYRQQSPTPQAPQGMNFQKDLEGVSGVGSGGVGGIGSGGVSGNINPTSSQGSGSALLPNAQTAAQANASAGGARPYKLKSWVKQPPTQPTLPGQVSQSGAVREGPPGQQYSPMQMNPKAPLPGGPQGVQHGKAQVTPSIRPKSQAISSLKQGAHASSNARIPMSPMPQASPVKGIGRQDSSQHQNGSSVEASVQAGSARVGGDDHLNSPRTRGARPIVEENPYPKSLATIANAVPEARVAQQEPTVAGDIQDPLLQESSIAKSQDAALAAVVNQMNELESQERRNSSAERRQSFYGETKAMDMRPATTVLEEHVRNDPGIIDNLAASSATSSVPLQSISENMVQEGQTAPSQSEATKSIGEDLSPLAKLDAIFKNTMEQVGKLHSQSKNHTIGLANRSSDETPRQDPQTPQPKWSLRRPYQGVGAALPSPRNTEIILPRAMSEHVGPREDKLYSQQQPRGPPSRAMSVQSGDSSDVVMQAQEKLQAARAQSLQDRRQLGGSQRVQLGITSVRRPGETDSLGAGDSSSSSSSSRQIQIGRLRPSVSPNGYRQQGTQQGSLRGPVSAQHEAHTPADGGIRQPFPPQGGPRANSENVRSMARSPVPKATSFGGASQVGRSLSPEMQDLRQRRMMMMNNVTNRRNSQSLNNVGAIPEALQVADDNFWNTIHRYMDQVQDVASNQAVNMCSPRKDNPEMGRKIVNLAAMSRGQSLPRDKSRKADLGDDGSTEDTSDLAGSSSEYSDHIRRLEKAIVDEKQSSREERAQRDKMQQILARELAAQKDAHARDVRHLESNMDKVLGENRRLSSLIEKLLTRMDGGDQDQAAVLSKLQQIRGQQEDYINVLQSYEAGNPS